uniref:Uncharacterized protein n=1 Tax=Plectus sambesii TaxID=2011161 RepID=A0A914VIU8_9BILA
MVSSVFHRLREGKKAEKEKVKQDEMKSAIRYLSQESIKVDQRSMDMVKPYLSRRKATPVNVNDDSLKAAKIMKKILSSEDGYDKAADCYISSQSGGMFGTATREKAYEIVAIQATQRSSRRSSFRRSFETFFTFRNKNFSTIRYRYVLTKHTDTSHTKH